MATYAAKIEKPVIEGRQLLVDRHAAAAMLGGVCTTTLDRIPDLQAVYLRGRKMYRVSDLERYVAELSEG